MRSGLWAAGAAALMLAGCGGGTADKAAETPAPDAAGASTPATGTAAETPELRPQPRGRDGEYGKITPGGAGAPAASATDSAEPTGGTASQTAPEEVETVDPGGEEKP